MLKKDEAEQEKAEREAAAERYRNARKTIWKTLTESGLKAYEAQTLLQNLQDKLKYHIESLKV